MPVDFSTLAVGYNLSRQSFTLDTDTVERCVDAVQDRSGLYDATAGLPIAPPMCVAALALRGVLDALGIPEGAVHAGQEQDFLAAVPVGATLECSATVAQNSTRGAWRFVAVNMEVHDTGHRKVMTAKCTIMTPA